MDGFTNGLDTTTKKKKTSQKEINRMKHLEKKGGI